MQLLQRIVVVMRFYAAMILYDLKSEKVSDSFFLFCINDRHLKDFLGKFSVGKLVCFVMCIALLILGWTIIIKVRIREYMLIC